MSDLEKVSINVSAMDLAKMDLLVENSFYKDRTDFVRTAIRNQINTHADFIEQAIKNYEVKENKDSKIAVTVGTERITKEELVDAAFKNEGKSRIFVIGSLTIDADVDLELVLRTVHSIKVLGIFNAPSEIKKYYKK